MTDEELLLKATSFTLLAEDRHDMTILFGRIRHLVVEFRGTTDDGKPSWAILNGMNECLNRKGSWEYEPFPSSRTYAFLQRCRWNDLRAAVDFAEAHMAKYPLGYKLPKQKKSDPPPIEMLTRGEIGERAKTRNVPHLADIIKKAK